MGSMKSQLVLLLLIWASLVSPSLQATYCCEWEVWGYCVIVSRCDLDDGVCCSGGTSCCPYDYPICCGESSHSCCPRDYPICDTEGRFCYKSAEDHVGIAAKKREMVKLSLPWRSRTDQTLKTDL